MNDEPYSMREFFAEDMAGVHETLHVADRLVQKFLPRLGRHLAREHIHISMFATQWIMTVFASTFPFELVARVWDSYIAEGRKVIYRVLLSLLGAAQRDILDLDLEDSLAYLRDSLPSKVDGPSVVRSSLRISLKQKHIRKYANEWRAGKQRGRRRRSFFNKSPESRLPTFPGKSAKHAAGGSDNSAARKPWPATKRRTL